MGPGSLASDFDADGDVDLDDFFAFAAVFGTKTGEAGFEDRFDLVPSGEIDFDDFFFFAGDFGEERMINFGLGIFDIGNEKPKGPSNPESAS